MHAKLGKYTKVTEKIYNWQYVGGVYLETVARESLSKQLKFELRPKYWEWSSVCYQEKGNSRQMGYICKVRKDFGML